MMTADKLTDLLMKHLQGSLSDSEQEQLNQWLLQSERNRLLFGSIHDEEQLRQLVLLYDEEEAENNEALILSRIRQQIVNETPVRRISLLRRWGWVAASVLLAVGIGGYLLQNRKEAAPIAKMETDILPGREGAILTLADGSQVVLDSLGNGVIATQNGKQVLLKNGELAYAGDAGSGEVVYNNLTTPKGRQFQILLPDGTKVWLNAASSLRYPTAFSGSNREVEVTGEVYFEVAKNAHQPFIIHLNNKTKIQVLGTQFNVNAYSNEAAIRTTLVEGSIKIVSGASAEGGPSVVLHPGQQAQINNAGGDMKVMNNVDIDKVTAWKSGLFNFEDSGLEEVMRQVERWYDIEVVYEKNIPDIRFGGKLSNDVSLSGLLRSLQESEVHFRIEGRKLIVLP
jgi:transmembrane sensor